MMKNWIIASICLLACPAWAAERVLMLEEPELAGISGFRAYWDKPVVLAENGATRLSDHGRFGKGQVGDWSTDQPGAIVFDAVHRRVLVRFPDAAEAVAAKLAEGFEVRKAELLLPFIDTEFFPMDYDMPAGMSFLGDQWVKTPPRWHAVGWALRQPWKADLELGPTYNASINGKVFWGKYGAQDDQSDRGPTRFGPAEVSYEVTEGAMDVTACFTDPVFGKTLDDRLRQFADCGLLIAKEEVYDARYWNGYYDWGSGTGQRGVRIGAPKLKMTFAPAAPAKVALSQAADVDRLAAGPQRGAPTAVQPSREAYERFAAAFAVEQPDWAPAWQWQRIQELQAMGGKTKGFPETYESYLQWLDRMLSLYPRAWKGFTSGKMSAEYAMYEAAIPDPVKDNLRLYWWAWLLPGRSNETMVHTVLEIEKGMAYYQQTGDWRGTASVYRTYCFNMGTMNFNSWATTGTMFGGWILGDEELMAVARHGYDQYMTRVWTWADGTNQEFMDHYYFAHTLSPMKTVADHAPTAQDRLAGRLNIQKHVDEMVACWHPNLRRFVSTSSRTGIAYPLYLQEGVNYIMHTLSGDGALTDVGAKDVAGRADAFALEFSPRQVAIQSSASPWASAALTALVDGKPLPYEVTRAYTRWGGFGSTPLWKKSYLGQHYGLASMDVGISENIPLMAQWRREDAKADSYRDLGTLFVRYGINDTEFLDSIYHGTDTWNPNGIVGAQGGPTCTVQGRNSLIVFASPTRDLTAGHKNRPVPQQVNSLQTSIALLNFEAQPSWKLYIDGQPVDRLPAKARFGQRITIHDGVTYLGIIPIPATDLGRDTEVLISTKGEPTQMQGGGEVKVALTIDAYNYRSDTPLDIAVDPDALDHAVGGFVIQLADATEFDSFEAFQAHFAAAPFDWRWAPDTHTLHVAYGHAGDRLEAGFNPGAPLSQPTTQVFPYRRYNQRWPYLDPGVYRDTTVSLQSTTGRLEKNGAVLTTQPGKMSYLRAFPQQDSYVAINPFREPVPMRLEAAGVTVKADGLVGQIQIELRPDTRRIAVDCAASPADTDEATARALIIEGLKGKPVVTVDGKVVEPTPMQDAFLIPIISDWSDEMAQQTLNRQK